MIIAIVKRSYIQNPGAGDIIITYFDKIQRINQKTIISSLQDLLKD